MTRTYKWLMWIAVLAVFAFACQAVNTLQALPASPDAQGIIDDQSSIDTENPALTALQSTELPPVVSPLEEEELLVRIYEQVNLGVVSIRVYTQEGQSLGSGFVYDKEGHIVTNYHVIEGVDDLAIEFPSGYKTRGEVIGTDLDSDLAVIEVDAPASELFPLKLGDSSNLKVGQTVVAIGNPFGLSGTMSSGIISGLGRTLESFRQAPGGSTFTAGDVIQTDTAINPGNSGGPLLNLRGEVIGVNRAIRTFNFTLEEEPLNSGIGFAIAINIVKRVVPALIEDGSFDYPYLGISSLGDAEFGLVQQEALDLPRSTGVYVTTVTPGSPADKAGLRGGTRPTEIPGLNAGGDLIIAIDGRPVRTFGELLSYLFNYKSPGDKITLTVLRGNEVLELDLTLERRP